MGNMASLRSHKLLQEDTSVILRMRPGFLANLDRDQILQIVVKYRFIIIIIIIIIIGKSQRFYSSLVPRQLAGQCRLRQNNCTIQS